MSPLTWQYIGIFSTALAVLLAGLLLWRRRELRRYEAMEVAQEVAPWGFDQLTKLLNAYAIGNYIGKDSVARVIREIIQELKGGGLPNMLRKIGWKVVKNVFLQNADDRKELRALLSVADATAVKTPPIEPPVT